jgi:hypothetical protein
MRVFRVSGLFLAAMLATHTASGQIVVSNPGFDTDVTGWTALSEASIVWSPLDADGNPGSGSAFVTNMAITTLDATGARQCLDGVTGLTEYLVSANTLVPSGQSETGYTYLVIQWYDSPSCGGSQLGADFTPGIISPTADVWYRDWVTVEAPSGAQTARLILNVLKYQDTGTLEAHFDNVGFVEIIFVDGFESGDTTSWSVTIP